MAFTNYFSLRDFPASPRVLLLFGEFLLRGYRAPRSVTNGFSSLRGFHLDRDLDASAFESRQLSLLRCSKYFAGDRGPSGVVFAALLSVTFFTLAMVFMIFPGFHPSLTWMSRMTRCGFGSSGLNATRERGRDISALATSPQLASVGRRAAHTTGLGGTGQPQAHTSLSQIPRGPHRLQGQFLHGRGGSPLAGCFAGPRGYGLHIPLTARLLARFRAGPSIPDLQSLGGWRGSLVHLYLPATAARQRAATFLAPSTSN